MDMGHKAPNAAIPGLSPVRCNDHIIVWLISKQKSDQVCKRLSGTIKMLDKDYTYLQIGWWSLETKTEWKEFPENRQAIYSLANHY